MVPCSDRENINANIIPRTGHGKCPRPLLSEGMPAKQPVQDSAPLRGRALAAVALVSRGIDCVPLLSVGSVSELSVDSRTSTLSRRGGSRLAPSSAELERSYMERKRHELRQMRARNEKSCYEAIYRPDVPHGVRQGQRSAVLTVPQEFSLSTSRATTPARSIRSDAESDSGFDAGSDSDGGSEWSRSLRHHSARRSEGESKPRSWKPELTVPRGPALQTSSRARSSSVRSGPEHGTDQPSASSWQASLRGGARESSRSASPSHSVASWCSVCSSRSQSRARSRQRCRGRSNLETPSPNRSVASWRSPASSSVSDMSLVSDASRSRPTRGCSRRRTMSTEELQRTEVDVKRHELADLLRRNERSCREAIRNPDLGGRQHSASITVPKEFNLSRGSTRAPAHQSGSHSARQRRDWSHSLRQPLRSAESLGPRELTVPEGPQLMTSRRTRSTSAEPRPPSQHTMSRHRLPREQAAIENHLGRTASARALHEDPQRLAAGRSQPVRPPPHAAGPDHGARPGGAGADAGAEARAQRARLAAQARHEQALANARERLCVF
uniref:Uncharacterized protein n=1 Tax=Alexandrium monilatum TaxID=311494 RepID=A0A7S4UXC7_9DINO